MLGALKLPFRGLGTDLYRIFFTTRWMLEKRFQLLLLTIRFIYDYRFNKKKTSTTITAEFAGKVSKLEQAIRVDKVRQAKGTKKSKLCSTCSDETVSLIEAVKLGSLKDTAQHISFSKKMLRAGFPTGRTAESDLLEAAKRVLDEHETPHNFEDLYNKVASKVEEIKEKEKDPKVSR